MTRPTRTIQNPEAHCSGGTYGFGAALGGAGDYNGDGRADLAVGARCLPDTGFAEIDGPDRSFYIRDGPPGSRRRRSCFEGLTTTLDSEARWRASGTSTTMDSTISRCNKSNRLFVGRRFSSFSLDRRTDLL